MEQSLISSLTQLTNVSDNILEKFIPISEYAIGHAVHESMCRKEDLTSVDIGIGVINIRVVNDEVRYKFIPSKELSDIVEKTVITKTSPLILKITGDLQDKINRSYRELL